MLPSQRVVGSFEMGLETSANFIGLGGMSRIDVIKSLIRRRVPGAVVRPKGLFLAGHPEARQMAKKRVKTSYKCRPYPYSQFGRALAPVEHGMDWDGKPESETFKKRQRHGEHALTRIAARLKRKWH